MRNYPFGPEASHAVGYVGAINESEYRHLRLRGYTPNDDIGKDGLEAQYDAYLRGTPGGERIEVDAQGQLVRRLGPTNPIPGDSLVLTLDWHLQTIVERALQNELAARSKLVGRRLAGAAVVIDPHDGGILALAAYPNFNPNDFATGIKESTYATYLNDPLRPLYDRAIGAATATGSTFKLITWTAAISTGVIGRDQVLYVSCGWNCHCQLFRDIAAGCLGTVDFLRGLADSSDGYFYQLGYRLGHERLRRFCARVRARPGARHRIYPVSFRGTGRTNAWTMKVYGLPLEPKATSVSSPSGQGAMEATPLQMANAVAAVVSGGTLWRPHLVAEIRTGIGWNRAPLRSRRRSARSRRARASAARSARRDGSSDGAVGHRIRDGRAGYCRTAARRETVETGGGSGPNTTWFVAYAPAKNSAHSRWPSTWNRRGAGRASRRAGGARHHSRRARAGSLTLPVAVCARFRTSALVVTPRASGNNVPWPVAVSFLIRPLPDAFSLPEIYAIAEPLQRAFPNNRARNRSKDPPEPADLARPRRNRLRRRRALP